MKVRLVRHTLSGPAELGYAELRADQTVSLVGFRGLLGENLRQGLVDPNTRQRTTIADGADFLRAMLKHFTGTYIRAEQV